MVARNVRTYEIKNETAEEELFTDVQSDGQGLSEEEARKRQEKYGPNAIEEKRVNPLLKFFGYFWGPIPWMIEVAAVLSIVVGHWPELIIISVLLVFNAVIGFWQEHQASNAVEALKKQLALKARVKRDGKWRTVDATTLVPGDVIRLRLGDIIPADVKFLEGDYISVDQSALTGESLPVNKGPGETGYSGSVARQGEMVSLVTGTGSNTFLAKTAKLVENAGAVSHFQKAVLIIGDYLIYLSLGLAAALIADRLLLGDSFISVFQFILILVIAAIPVAMPAVLTVTMAIGASALAVMKAIVTRLQSIEEIAGIDILCSDKTGTLTKNELVLGQPVALGAENAQDLILAGALASKEENQDVMDLAVISGLDDRRALDSYTQLKFVPFDPVVKRTEATVKDDLGRTFRVTKGAPQIISELCGICDGTKAAAECAINDLASKGYRTLGVARTDEEGLWKFLGILPLYDPPREDSAETIRRAEEHGIQVKMVTGDNLAIGREISRQLGMGNDLIPADDIFGREETTGRLSRETEVRIEEADGFAQVFPEHKYRIVKALQDRGHLVAMTGDGVNDAPALKQAEVGVAVSGATDAARAAASLVLTAPGLSVIVKAVEEARRIFERMNSYAIYRITETIRIMFFVALAMMVFNFYPITAIMIILLALLNDLPILTIAYDNTWLEPMPVRWNMHRVLSVSTTLGLIGVAETFGLLLIGKFLLNLDSAALQSFIYLKLAVAGHLTLFVARTRRPFLRKPRPAPVLLAAVFGTQAVAVMIVGFGLLMAPISWSYIGLVWGYCLVWVFVEDWAKLHVYSYLSLRAGRRSSFLRRIRRPLSLHAHEAEI